MGTPQKQGFDVIQYKQDRQAYNYWFQRQFGAAEDEEEACKVSDTIYAAVRLELSEKQRTYFTEYYFEGMTMEEIAIAHGINKSSVSRCVKRSLGRIAKVLKYVDPKLLRLFEKGETNHQKRYNKARVKRFK